MKISLVVDDDLRKEVKNLLRGQVTSLVRHEDVVKDAIIKAFSKEARINGKTFQDIVTETCRTILLGSLVKDINASRWGKPDYRPTRELMVVLHDVLKDDAIIKIIKGLFKESAIEQVKTIVRDAVKEVLGKVFENVQL